ncbi:MAG: hypothetical protein ACREUW_07260 [Burkholderiales bacterium]
MAKSVNAREGEIASQFARILENVRWNLEENFPQAFSANCDEKRFSANMGTSRRACLNALQKGMAIFRFEGDANKAKIAFAEGAFYISQYPLLVRSLEAEGIGDPAFARFRFSELFEPFFCGLLAGQKECCDVVVASSLSAIFQGQDPEPNVESPLLIRSLAMFSNDDTRFDSYPIGKLPEKTLYPVHFEILDAIRGSNNERVNALLARAETEYLARGKSRGDRYPLGYGGGKIYNALCFDFIAAGLARIALLRGIEVKIDSEIIPAAFFQHWST